jgi:hypothetical protein
MCPLFAAKNRNLSGAGDSRDEPAWQYGQGLPTPLPVHHSFSVSRGGAARDALAAGVSASRTDCRRCGFRAAAENSPVAMRHVVKSIEREYAKLGKIFVAADFDRAENDRR